MRSTPKRSRIVEAAWACVALVMLVASVNCNSVTPRNGWSRQWGPMVPHDTFPGDCSICHLPDRWDVLRDDFEFDHEAETGYALVGAHREAASLRCHNDRGPVEVYVARSCGGCHVDPHRGQLGLTCSECHNEQNWQPTGVITDHALTRFPLVGPHAITPCESCHPQSLQGDFRNAPVECHLCHQQDALAAQPSHVLNGWVVDCQDCHAPVNWNAVGFNHDFFPLIGGHANVDCLQCHPNAQFGPLDPNCFACHEQDYIAAPNHVANGFSTDCTECHNIFAWDDTD